MDMQETEVTAEDTKSPNIYQRINAVQREVTYVQKDRKKGMQYAVTSHDAVVAKLRPSMVANGIVTRVSVMSHVQDGNRTEANIQVGFHNMDMPEDCLQVEAFGYGIDSQDKGPGKAVSYAFKYALLKVFCLETGEGEDPDFQQVEHEPATAPSKQDGQHSAPSVEPMGTRDEREALYDDINQLKDALGLDTNAVKVILHDLECPPLRNECTKDQLQDIEKHMSRMLDLRNQEK
jgi:hypothetical protein